MEISKSFPLPIEGREDWFSIDPHSFNIQQLTAYKKAILRFMQTEKKLVKRMINHFNARIRVYNRGIKLARKTMKTNQRTRRQSSVKSTDHVDPKTLTLTQLQLYILGITEELHYENQRINEIKSESASRLSAYQQGLEIVNEELSRRKEK